MCKLQDVCSLALLADLALMIKQCNTGAAVPSSFAFSDRSLQPGNVPECGAAVSCHGDGWLWEPEGVTALSLSAHENRR